MRRLFLYLPVLLTACLSVPAQASDSRIGIVVPISGSLELLGMQMQAGAQAAARLRGLDIMIVDDRCTAEGGAEAAQALLAAEVAIIVGFLCSDSIEAALPPLTKAGVPVITPGVRATGLTDQRQRTGWLVWRTAPRADQERGAIGDILPQLWADHSFAILDDGATHQRDIAEHLRLAAEEAGLKPALVASFRPGIEGQTQLVAQLRRLEINHAFIAGERAELGRIAQDAADAGHELVLAGGEALRAAPATPDLAPGTLMIGLPEGSDMPGAGEVLPLAVAEGYGLPAFTAVQIAAEALAIQKEKGQTLPEILGGETFSTLEGVLDFDEKGDLIGSPYRLFRFDGEAFVEIAQ